MTNKRLGFHAALFAAFGIGLSSQYAFGQSAAGSPERNLSELNISIAVFDPGVPEDPLEIRRQRILPEVREIEALLLPFMLREALVRTGEWGAVRIVPESEDAAEILISGAIVRSDGNGLELSVRVSDAGGQEWIDHVYVSEATSEGADSEEPTDLYGFESLFDAIAEDLRVARAARDEAQFAEIVEISFLRYATELAPSIFDGYLFTAPDGTVEIQRLPAENDPMLERIERIRQSEYVFIDTVDEQFQDLHGEIVSIYDLWLEYRRQVAQFESREIERVASSQSNGPRGSYQAIRSHYDNYKWARMQQQRQANRAQAFDNEVGPTVNSMQARVAQLEIWLADQYAEWRGLLEELFALETGFQN